MKPTILAIICFFFSFISFSQERFLQYSSKDSINKQPRVKGSLGANLKLNGYYDVYGGLQESETFNIGNIDVFGEDDSQSFNMDLHQTQIVLESMFTTKKGKSIFAMVEVDFWGGNGHLRLRKAYVQTSHFLIGQNWVTFSDSEIWPNIMEWEGPPSGVWVRQPMISYFNNFNNKNWKYTLSINSPITDYDKYGELEPLIEEAFQNTPDLTLVLKHSKSWGHLRVASIFRSIQYKFDDVQNSFFGYGVAFSGIYWKNKNNFQFQITGGEGISAYTTSVQGFGFDGFPTIQGEVKPTPSYGGWASYELHYAPKFYSTFVLGYTRYFANDAERYILSTDIFDSETLYFGDVDNIHYYGIVNFMYDPFERMTFGIEMDYGNKRFAFDGYANEEYYNELHSRDALRISFGFMYYF